MLAVKATESVKIEAQPLVMFCWQELFDAFAHFPGEKERWQASSCVGPHE
jgi:hypothetical protein